MSEPREIRLRLKYRRAVRGRYQSSHNDGRRKPNVAKRGYDKHVALFGTPPRKIMVMVWPGGRCRMEVA